MASGHFSSAQIKVASIRVLFGNRMRGPELAYDRWIDLSAWRIVRSVLHGRIGIPAKSCSAGLPYAISEGAWSIEIELCSKPV